ncbi:MAG: hypothetical protein ACJAVV_002457 [Alphaproteobacteria bacterium]
MKDLAGMVVTIRISDLNFRAFYHEGNGEVFTDESIPFQNVLNQLGFVNSANLFLVNDKVQYYQFSVGWEKLDYFARLELTTYDTDAYFVPKTAAGYFALSYKFYPYTFDATFAKNRVDYSEVSNEIRVGISPQLDFLAQQFDFASNAIKQDELQTITLRVRYELRTNVALKADGKFINSQVDTEDPTASPSPFCVQENAELFQVAIEWVF